MVERCLAKANVAGSNPVFRSKKVKRKVRKAFLFCFIKEIDIILKEFKVR